jgi:hypothetical protein
VSVFSTFDQGLFRRIDQAPGPRDHVLLTVAGGARQAIGSRLAVVSGPGEWPVGAVGNRPSLAGFPRGCGRRGPYAGVQAAVGGGPRGGLRRAVHGRGRPGSVDRPLGGRSPAAVVGSAHGRPRLGFWRLR